jgi:Uma2 family endonuclease
MTSAARKLEPMTVAEFDDFLERQGDDASLFELVDGVVVMMTNPTRRHGTIVGNIGARLKFAMERRGCQSFQGDVRVQRDSNRKANDKPKPDVVVRCGSSDAESELLTYIDDPVVVVEVLSPSTMDLDRGKKLDFYKSLTTLQHIVIVYQDQVRVEHYRRQGEDWTTDKALAKPTDVIDLTAVAFAMTIAEAYSNVVIG